jgi:TonB family protein
MAHRPMSRPEPFDPPAPGGGLASVGENPVGGTDESELADGVALRELAAALSAHGGGALSADLALDLVLNEIVEHARLATGATAAAIALARGDEIVCRATTGSNAPDLGVQLNVHSGLSGACVQSKKWQRCDDTETDSRVDAEVCRDLGVRSILVFPVVRDDELLGVFEIFSPRPNAFSDREIQTLEALSRSIVNNVNRADDVLALPVFPGSSSATETSAGVEEVDEVNRLDANSAQIDDARIGDAEIDQVNVDPPHAPVDLNRLLDEQHEASLFLAESTPVLAESSLEATADIKTPRRDPWMGVLTLAVIAIALFLGWMMGYVRSPRASVGPKAKTAVNALPQPPQVKATENSSVNSTAAVPVPDKPAPATSPKTPASSQPPGTAAPPVGGLVVYDKGKVIFQTPPRTPSDTTTASINQPITVPSKVADHYLVQRVEPEYPEAAREQHIQGPVVLEALVGKDGAVEKLSTMSGDPQLATAATDAVRQWRFKPFLRNGSPEEFQTQITVSFRLP